MSDLIFDGIRKVFPGGVAAVEDFTLTTSWGAAFSLRGSITLVEPLGHETLTHLRVGSNDVIARGWRSQERLPDNRRGRIRWILLSYC
jgi:hypothetical protein